LLCVKLMDVFLFKIEKIIGKPNGLNQEI